MTPAGDNSDYSLDRVRVEAARELGQAGFAAIEVLAGLAIVAVAIALTMPVTRAAHTSRVVAATAVEIAATMRMARAAAMQAGAERSLAIDLRQRSYWVEHVSAPRPIPRSIAIEFVAGAPIRDAGQVQHVRFMPTGESSGGSLRLSDRSASATITVDWLMGAVRVAR